MRGEEEEKEKKIDNTTLHGVGVNVPPMSL